MRSAYPLVAAALVCLLGIEAHAACQNAEDCSPAAPAPNELYGFINTHRTLTAASPGPVYEVLGDVVVRPGASLTLEPGVTLRFRANKDTLQGGLYSDRSELWVQSGASLVAVGTAADSVGMISSAGGSAEWGALRLDLGASASIAHLALCGATTGIIGDAPLTISRTSIRDADLGIQLTGGPHALDSLAISNVRDGIQASSASGMIRNCVVEGRGGAGTGIHMNPSVSTAASDSSAPAPNRISGFERGIRTYGSSHVEHCVLFGNGTGISIEYGGGAVINYCTIVDNNVGVRMQDGSELLLNTIFADNGYQAEKYASCGNALYVDYCDLWGGSPYASCNVLFGPNIANFDPFFVDAGSRDYRLQPHSIFVGFSNSGGQIGAYGPACPPGGTLSSPDPTPELIAFPNPARTTARLDMGGAVPANSSVAIYDVTGRVIRQMHLSPGSTRWVEWDTADESGRKVPNGVYLWRFQSPSGARLGRLSVLR